MNKIIICPVCLGKKTSRKLYGSHTHGNTLISNNEKFQYLQCSSCQSVYLTNIKFNEAYYRKYYSNEAVGNNNGLKINLEKYINIYSQFRKQRILNKFSSKKNILNSILDVGCGKGEFLHKLSDKLYKKYGIEKDFSEYTESKSKGITVYIGDILNYKFGSKKYDIITLWHVLEHIPEPKKLMLKLNQLLTPEGVLIMATPNTDSLGFKMTNTKWFHFDAPRHVILYNEKGIQELCKASGFEIKSIVCENFEFPLDLLWSMKNANKINNLVSQIIFYPILKVKAKETLTYIIRKTKLK